MSFFERRLRLGTGLFLAVYIFQHLLNHSIGLVSYEVMDGVREFVVQFWRHPLVQSALYFSLVSHFLLALWSVFRRTTLKIPRWELAQLILGLSIIPLISLHVSGVWGGRVLLGIDINYENVITYIFQEPWRIVRYMLLIVVAWLHVCIGLHFWLRLRRWYKKYLPVMYAVAVLIPVLSILSVTRVSMELDDAGVDTYDEVFENDDIYEETFEEDDPVDVSFELNPETLDWAILLVFTGLLMATLLGRSIRHSIRQRSGAFRVSHPSGKYLVGIRGQTLLETIRDSGTPHASVCGGRARCTTCRVRVSSGLDACGAPDPLEAQALTRIRAAPDVRLACQTRPSGDVHITPLVPVRDAMNTLRRPGSVQGTEQQVVAMFVDLRGSTRMGEKKLPYDVLFILNRFFAEMTEVLQESHGHYAQFAGDGLMALYGLKRGWEQGCRDAMTGAKGMQGRIGNLNDFFADELDEPLRIGIGIHCGEAIVGTMGPPMSPNYSAIGDNINAAARLESQTKNLDCTLVVSKIVTDTAGYILDDSLVHRATVRGKTESLLVYAVGAKLLSSAEFKEADKPG